MIYEGDKTFTATVIASIPHLGITVVQPNLGPDRICQPEVGYLAHAPGDFGCLVTSAPVPGTTVLCAREDKYVSGEVYIVSDVSDKADALRYQEDRQLFHLSYAPSADLTYNFDSYNKALGRLSLNTQSHNFGVWTDILAGDYSICDRNGGGFVVGRLFTLLRGSEYAFVKACDITHSVQICSKRFEIDQIQQHTVHEDGLFETYRAISVREGLGFREDENPLKEEDGELQWNSDKKPVPYWRVQRREGRHYEGVSDIVVIHDVESDETVYTEKSGQIPVFEHKTRYDGSVSRRTAHSCDSIKSPYIPAVIKGDYEPAKEEEIAEAPDEETFFEDRGLNKLNLYMSTAGNKNEYKFLRDTDSIGYHIVSTEDIRNTMPAEEEKRTPPTGLQSYPLPPAIEITDPVTGEKAVYYASSSFITQEADGSILLRDGYGSEIRMCKGNIYISPALDLFLRPGRDLISMAAQNLVLNAQGRLILNTKKEALVRSSNSMKFVSGTSGTGSLVIDSRAVASENEVASGLILKSKRNMALVSGSNMYIGMNSQTSGTRNGVEDTSGTIIIDAGSNGSIVATTGMTSFSSSSFTVSAVDSSSSSGSIMTLTSGEFNIITQAITTCAHIKQTGLDGVVTIRRPYGTGYNTVTVSGPSGTPGFMTAGSISSDSQILALRGITTWASCVASSVASVSGSMGSVRQEDLDRAKPSEQTKISTQVENLAETNKRTLIDQLRTELYQDVFISLNEFAFPSTEEYHVPVMYKMPGMAWQYRIDGGSVWQEDYLESYDGKITACWPGYEAWESGTVSVPGYKEGATLKNGYAINVTGE